MYNAVARQENGGHRRTQWAVFIQRSANRSPRNWLATASLVGVRCSVSPRSATVSRASCSHTGLMASIVPPRVAPRAGLGKMERPPARPPWAGRPRTEKKTTTPRGVFRPSVRRCRRPTGRAPRSRTGPHSGHGSGSWRSRYRARTPTTARPRPRLRRSRCGATQLGGVRPYPTSEPMAAPRTALRFRWAVRHF